MIKAEQACRRSDPFEKRRKQAADVALMRKHSRLLLRLLARCTKQGCVIGLKRLTPQQR